MSSIFSKPNVGPSQAPAALPSTDEDISSADVRTAAPVTRSGVSLVGDRPFTLSTPGDGFSIGTPGAGLDAIRRGQNS